MAGTSPAMTEKSLTAFRSLHLLRDRPRAAGVVDGDEGEGRVGDLLLEVGLEPHPPGLDMDLHRGAADALHRRIDLEHVADPHRADELHGVERHGDDAAAGAFDAGDAAGLV